MSVKDLVVKLEAVKKDEEIDWQERLKQWIQQVDALYATVEGWLKELLEEEFKRIEIRREMKPLSEEFLGNYEVDKLIISVANRSVVLDPVGRHIIGARGRVDLYRIGYKADGYMLLLFADDDEKPYWGIAKIADKRESGAFDKDSFERFLEEALRA